MKRLLAIFASPLIRRLLAAILLGGIPEFPPELTLPAYQVQAGEAADVPKLADAETPAPSAEVHPVYPDLQKQLQRELGEAGVSENENPFLSILQQMREVEMLLGRGQTGDRTQRIQKQILAELDRLIIQAQQSGQAKTKVSAQGKPDSASSGSPQGAASPSQPKQSLPGAPKEPTLPSPPDASGKEEIAQIQQIRTLLQEVWGLLPERQRQQMLESPVEEFLPKYKPLIIDYFRRLAERRSASQGN